VKLYDALILKAVETCRYMSLKDVRKLLGGSEAPRPEHGQSDKREAKKRQAEETAKHAWNSEELRRNSKRERKNEKQ